MGRLHEAAVRELGGGFQLDDVTNYFSSLGIDPPPQVVSVSVDGGTNSPTTPDSADGEVMLDLAYEEDSRAEVDMNLVMTSGKKIVEIQGTAEQHPFDDAQLKKMMDFGRRGIESLIAKQQALLSKLMLRQ